MSCRALAAGLIPGPRRNTHAAAAASWTIKMCAAMEGATNAAYVGRLVHRVARTAAITPPEEVPVIQSPMHYSNGVVSVAMAEVRDGIN